MEEKELVNGSNYILSVVIPSYNSEKWLERCLDSFVGTGFDNQFEVIVVNDGSTDKTYDIAEKYSNKYEFINVLNKKNGGHGSTINCAKEIAKGKYFKVVDSDDWVDKQNFTRLLTDLKFYDEDIVINDYITVDESNLYKEKEHGFDVVYGKKISFQEIKDVVTIHLQSLTIKTELLRNEDIKYTENCYYEDFEYSLYVMKYCKSLIFLNYSVYNYLIGQKSQSVADENVLKNESMFQKVLFNSIDFYKNSKEELDKEQQQYFINNITNFARQGYNIYIRNLKNNEAKNLLLAYDKKLKDKSKFFYSNVKKKYMYLRLVCNPIGYYLCGVGIRVYKKIN